MLSRGNYPLLLSAFLGGSARVSNFGVGGRTAVNGSDGYERTPELAWALSSAPTTVVLMLGTNDCKCMWRHNLYSFEMALERIARAFLALPSRPSLVLMAPPPVIRPSLKKCNQTGARNEFQPETLAEKIVPAIARVARRLATSSPAARLADSPCTKSGATFLDLQQLWAARQGCDRRAAKCRSLYYADGVHTSDLGAYAIARAVGELVSPCMEHLHDVSPAASAHMHRRQRFRQKRRDL